MLKLGDLGHVPQENFEKNTNNLKIFHQKIFLYILLLPFIDEVVIALQHLLMKDPDNQACDVSSHDCTTKGTC